MGTDKSQEQAEIGQNSAAGAAESMETEPVATKAGNANQPIDQDGGFKVTDERGLRLDDEPVNAETSPEAQSAVEELQAKLKESETRQEEAERQVRDFADRFRHAQAQLRTENDEMRTRLQRNFEQKLETARGDALASLLDVLDNLKLAVAAASAHQGKGPEFEALLGGVRATAQIFESKMGTLGLTPLVSVGEVFNPELHEAVEMVACPPDQEGRVVGEMQTGYRFGTRLLRPARVRVGKAE